MAVEIVELVPRLEAALTVPGAPAMFEFTTSTRTSWRRAIAGAFWLARLTGLFEDWRVDADGETIVPVEDDGDDFPEEYHQVLIEQAALTAIEMRYAGLANTRSKSGGQEFEQSRPFQLLNDLLKARRASLEQIKEDVAAGGAYAGTAVAFIDLALARHEQIVYGQGYWVR